MPIEETRELYRTMDRFRAVAAELAGPLGLDWFWEPERPDRRWRRRLAKAREAVGAQGEGAAAAGTPRWRQTLDLVEVQRRYAFEAKNYYRYHLFRRDRYRRAGLFASSKQMQTFLRTIDRTIAHEASTAISDKARFREHCRRYDLPSIPTVAVCREGAVEWPENAAGLPETDLFAKPVDAFGGTGARAWRFDGGCYLRPDGTAQTGADVLAELRACSDERTYVVQPRVCNHEVIERIAGETLTSVRVITVLDGGRPRARMQQARLPGTGAIVSNAKGGGMLVPIDETGTLGTGVFPTQPFRSPLARHPGTAQPVSGVRLPLWDEVRALAERAHATLAEAPMLGWDLAVTPDGPLLIEANVGFGVETFQVHDQPPLALTGLPQLALEYYDQTIHHT